VEPPAPQSLNRVALAATWHCLTGCAIGEILGLVTDTVSITVMEIVDNAIVLLVPGAMAAGLGELVFWWSLVLGLAFAFVAAFPVNRLLIARGRGHAVVHAYH
jgi:uncharacterized protein YqhQ